MTKQEILNLEGRELDAAVAEHVMGWTRERTEKNNWYEPESRLWKPVDSTTNLPRYSSNIVAAWEVVERLHELGYNLAIYCQRKGAQDEGVEVHVGKGDYNDNVVWPPVHHANTAPKAMCYAALLAVMEGDNND